MPVHGLNKMTVCHLHKLSKHHVSNNIAKWENNKVINYHYINKSLSQEHNRLHQQVPFPKISVTIKKHFLYKTYIGKTCMCVSKL